MLIVCGVIVAVDVVSSFPIHLRCAMIGASQVLSCANDERSIGCQCHRPPTSIIQFNLFFIVVTNVHTPGIVRYPLDKISVQYNRNHRASNSGPRAPGASKFPLSHRSNSDHVMICYILLIFFGVTNLSPARGVQFYSFQYLLTPVRRLEIPLLL